MGIERAPKKRQNPRHHILFNNPDSPPKPRDRTLRHSLFTRRNAERLNREGIIRRADFLPDSLRAIVIAYYDRGVAMPDLAALHHVSIRQMRYKIEHLHDVLSDPTFILAARFGHRLPSELAALARGYWIECLTMRELSAIHHKTLHHIRTQIKRAQSLLLIAMAGDQQVPPEVACRVLH